MKESKVLKKEFTFKNAKVKVFKNGEVDIRPNLPDEIFLLSGISFLTKTEIRLIWLATLRGG